MSTTTPGICLQNKHHQHLMIQNKRFKMNKKHEVSLLLQLHLIMKCHIPLLTFWRYMKGVTLHSILFCSIGASSWTDISISASPNCTTGLYWWPNSSLFSFPWLFLFRCDFEYVPNRILMPAETDIWGWVAKWESFRSLKWWL